MHFNSKSVVKGSVLKLNEGWATLIEPVENIVTFMESDVKVYGRQKWLVQWSDISELKKVKLSPQDRITQKTLSGKRCHRSIEFLIGKWSSLIKENEPDLIQNSDYMFDDFGGNF